MKILYGKNCSFRETKLCIWAYDAFLVLEVGFGKLVLCSYSRAGQEVILCIVVPIERSTDVLSNKDYRDITL